MGKVPGSAGVQGYQPPGCIGEEDGTGHALERFAAAVAVTVAGDGGVPDSG